MNGDETAARGPRVLVVDDELQIRRFLRISLRTEGYDVREAEDGTACLALAARWNPDVVVLDLGLPDMDGNDALAALREWSTVPVIVLSVRDRERDKVRALDLGADDYVTKPFGIDELLARLRAQLRSRRAPADGGRAHAAFDDGRVSIDLGRRRVTVDGARVRLTPKEYAVLQLLLVNAGRIVTQAQMLERVWGPSHVRDTHYLRIVVGKLRHKLGDDPTEQRYIETEPGVGYRFAPEG